MPARENEIGTARSHRSRENAMSDPPKSPDIPVDEDFILTSVDDEPGEEPIVLIGSSKKDDSEPPLFNFRVTPNPSEFKSFQNATLFGRITQSHWLVCYLIAAGIAAAIYWGFVRG
jgi:hypothetical protein